MDLLDMWHTVTNLVKARHPCFSFTDFCWLHSIYWLSLKLDSTFLKLVVELCGVSVVHVTASLKSPPGPSLSSINTQSAQFMCWNTNQNDVISTGHAEPLPGSSHSSFASTDSVPFMPAMQWSTYQGDTLLYNRIQLRAVTSNCLFRVGMIILGQKCFISDLGWATSACVMAVERSVISKPSHQMTCVFSMRSSVHSPLSKLPESRFGNIYYHANPHCILAGWPQSSHEFLVHDDIQNHLTSQHKALISHLLRVYF